MGGLGHGRSRLQESKLWEPRLRESRLCPSKKILPNKVMK